MAREDISYDFEDFGMSGQELQAKYDREHPVYTNLGYNAAMKDVLDEQAIPAYWTWVKQQIAKDDDSIPSNDVKGNPLPEETAATPEVQEYVVMTTLDEFVAHLSAWHQRKIAQLNHMLDIPAGTEFIVQLNNEPETKLILEGDVLQAFRGGLATALTELDKLPFTAVAVEKEPPPASEPAAPDVSG